MFREDKGRRKWKGRRQHTGALGAETGAEGLQHPEGLVRPVWIGVRSGRHRHKAERERWSSVPMFTLAFLFLMIKTRVYHEKLDNTKGV